MHAGIYEAICEGVHILKNHDRLDNYIQIFRILDGGLPAVTITASCLEDKEDFVMTLRYEKE